MTTKKHTRKSYDGQALLIVVVFMGAIMLGISVISGYLFTQRLKTSIDIKHSTQAIFAADAGIEEQLYDIFQRSNFAYPEDKTITGSAPTEEGQNAAEFSTTREYNGTNGFTIVSLGNLGVLFRQLRLDVTLFGTP